MRPNAGQTSIKLFNAKEANKNRRRENFLCAGLVQLFDLQDVLIKNGQMKPH